ncbi:hypothetical protein F2P56_005999 [Juglans regia]|uniref:Uncharacterized protein n=2 Tax=Juglans regia TaxID=51240 RepID=A0A833Y2Q9_JUGRE|nr:uncharacterized protein LOC108979703 [Juglans regia]KAF5474060.1 hypothetical protein F2P56_005999 [Juglans regia]
MKASLKFRDDQKPLFRAKVPLSILGLPFQSGIVAGESKELTLNLGTFFESGPSLKISYRPNETWNPFSLVVKTGIGSYGSPISSPMLMSAEFNLLGRGNPSFMLHFKPQFGDFSIKKSQSSMFDRTITSPNGLVSEDDASIEVVEGPAMNGAFYGKKITALTSDSPSGTIVNVLSGMEVAAKTTLPVRGRAIVNFRWGVRVPAELKSVGSNPTAGITFQKIPFLVMNKIGMEHVDGGDSKKTTAKSSPDLTLPANADVAEACFIVKRQLEVLQAENGSLKKAVEELRREFAAGTKSVSTVGESYSGKNRDMERNGIKSDRRNNEKEELKKAMMGATGA